MSARRIRRATRRHRLSHGRTRHPRTGGKDSRMSLINDALKRAQKAQRQDPSAGQQFAPLQPVDYTAPSGRFFRAVVGLLVMSSLGLSGWFFWRWWGSSSEPQPVANTANGLSLRSPAEAPTRVEP